MTCGAEIPGAGPCEVEGAHELDGRGRAVHVRGGVSWNGEPGLRELVASNAAAERRPLTQAEARAAAVWRP